MKNINNIIRRALALMAVMVVATATAMAQTAVKYIDKDGVEQTCSTYNTVEEGDNVTWSGGWYVVSGANVTITNSVTVSGAVSLILADGASLTVNGAANNAGVTVSAGNSLTVYGQMAGTGVLIATGGDKGAGIGGGKGQDSGDITINGGTVTATGTGGGAGIGGGIDGSIGDIEINRGTVTANGSQLATGIGAGDNSGLATVNFGTPDLNWAVCNLGATNGETPESWYGDYYAWGEITTKENYKWGTYKHCNGTINTLTKYNTDSNYGTVDNKTVLEAGDDAARHVLGGDWRMPTQAEWQALRDNNTFVWLAAGGKSDYVPSFTAVAAGYLVIKGGKNNIAMNTSVYMFLPAGGYYLGSFITSDGSDGHYWSSSLSAGHPYGAYYLYFNSGNVYMYYSSRYLGRSVRPVCQLQD